MENVTVVEAKPVLGALGLTSATQSPCTASCKSHRPGEGYWTALGSLRQPSASLAAVLVLHISVWSQCLPTTDSSELAVLMRPGVGEVQQGTGSSAVTAHS